jgi:predicted RNase H-like HicB family nuclease
VSETYTAVYARDGEEWVAEITGQPDVHGRGGSLGEAREQVRAALAARVAASPDELHIVDTIRPPAAISRARQEVKATRSEADKLRMWNNMTDHKTVEEWAEELDLANREPGALKWLKEYEGVQLGIDQLCHTITLAEEIARWGEVDLDNDVPAEESEPRA